MSFTTQNILLKKVAFPRLCLPVIATGSVLVNGVLLAFSILVIFLLIGHELTLYLLWLPLLVALAFGLGAGAGLILGVLNVFVRDIGQAVPVLLQFVFWGTPIVYMPEIVPESIRVVLQLNPLYYLVQAFQDVMVFNRAPDAWSLLIVTSICAALLAAALFMFRRASSELVDEL